MKLVIAAVAGIAVGVTAAYAESKKPQKMTEAQMDQVYAGAVPAPNVGRGVGTAKHAGGEYLRSNEGRLTATESSGIPFVGQGQVTVFMVQTR